MGNWAARVMFKKRSGSAVCRSGCAEQDLTEIRKPIIGDPEADHAQILYGCFHKLGPFCGCPCDQGPLILVSILGPPMFGNFFIKCAKLGERRS